MNGVTALSAALFALVATVSPGGATTLATASGSRFGLRRSVPLLAGIATGLATLAAAASLGLSGLMLAVPALQILTKVAGSIYLLWLAVGIARSHRPGTGSMDRPRGFRAGLVLLWLNPKGWAMTLAAAAAFDDPAMGAARTSVLLGVVFGLAAAASLTLWCCAGMLLARLITTDAGWQRLNLMLASLLVASIIPIWL